ncbi:type II secretion system F family protein [Streptomyces chryseus]|uniref:Membrane protein n=1 Tax=Streptomyces chryseus TaxID=68186 RepID=A0ABQ3DQB9_9ACTN|nr:type II secretion system F family protein [Streptomyces chryseus]GHB10494.1 membrane protein [Streptomyces chryseus]
MSGELVHKLGTAVSLAAVVVWMAFVWAGWRRERSLRRRLAALLAADVAGGAGQGPWHGRRMRAEYGARVLRWGPPLGAVAVAYALVGGPAGCAVGVVAAIGIAWWQRGREPSESPVDARRLPLAADLLAACVSAGAGPREASEAVGDSLGGPVGERLARAAAELRLGGEPADAWGRLGAIPGAAGLARALERASASGAPAAEPVTRVAESLRAARAREASARAQRAGVLMVGPVGLCFLPAFLVVGVVPVVIGLASGLMHSN